MGRPNVCSDPQMRGRWRKLPPVPAIPPVPRLGFGVTGIRRTVRNLILILPDGVFADPTTGEIYGRLGTRVGHICKRGYVRISSAIREQYAHRLVWHAVNGPIPPGMHVDHRNHVKDCNRISNLQLVTPERNRELTRRRGKTLRGERVGTARLTSVVVGRIRRMAGVKSDSAWAKELEVDRTTVRDARTGRTWRHIGTAPDRIWRARGPDKRRKR